MQIDKSISNECVVCGRSVELHEHYYGIGPANKYSSYRLVVAPLYYDDGADAGFCGPKCSNIKLAQLAQR